MPKMEFSREAIICFGVGLIAFLLCLSICGSDMILCFMKSSLWILDKLRRLCNCFDGQKSRRQKSGGQNPRDQESGGQEICRPKSGGQKSGGQKSSRQKSRGQGSGRQKSDGQEFCRQKSTNHSRKKRLVSTSISTDNHATPSAPINIEKLEAAKKAQKAQRAQMWFIVTRLEQLFDIVVQEKLELEEARQTSSASESESNCVICFEQKDGIFAFDCNHAMTCKRCAEELLKRCSNGALPKCPICRATITKVSQIFV